MRQFKRNQIERLELLRQHDRLAATHNREGEDEGTFLSRLTARIVDNLQITLRDLHIRYEDNVSNAESPFACGVMVQSFTFQTTDAEGNETFVDRAARRERFLHKAVKVACAGVYWDRLARDDSRALLQTRPDIVAAMAEMVHAMSKRMAARSATSTENRDDKRLWVLWPCSLSVRFTKNETKDFSLAAKYTIQADMNGVSCALSREQYEDMLFLDRAFAGRRAVESHFLSARCRPFYSATMRPCEWWDYAVRSVIVRRLHHRVNDSSKAGRTKGMRMRWTSVQKAGLDRRLYIEVYKMQIRKGGLLDPSTKEAKRAAEFEIAYPAEVVMALRNVAEDFEVAEQAKREQEKAAAATQAAAASGGTWYSYFFGGNPGPSSTASAATSQSSARETSRQVVSENGALHQVLTDEGRADLKKAYDEVVENEKVLAVPSDCNLFTVKIHLKNGKLALYQAKSMKPFLTATLEGVLSANVRPTNDWESQFRVQQFQILNGHAEGTPFHVFWRLGSLLFSWWHYRYSWSTLCEPSSRPHYVA
ncbi:hypothetical protein PINS_up016869 [Pythium insidiosum]|nr:hypothetical protein PINS_up016869 [Pythium insidiosum]